MSLQALFERFSRIDLDALNRSAELLTRRDNKYLLTSAQLAPVLDLLQERCTVLEIDGRQRFRYHSIYFDSADHRCFHDHNQDRRHRLKLRFRHYADSQLTFFEIKLKDRGNQTRKLRQPVPAELFGSAELTPELNSFLGDALASHPRRALPSGYVPTMRVDYERITLVCRDEAVRITLDNRLQFTQGDQRFETGDDLWVMEVKSATGRSWVDRLMVQQRIRTVPRCSKYCVGLSLVNAVKRVSRFTATANLIRRMA